MNSLAVMFSEHLRGPMWTYVNARYKIFLHGRKLLSMNSLVKKENARQCKKCCVILTVLTKMLLFRG